MTKLSNQVVQLFFAKKSSGGNFSSFDTSLSMNYNNSNRSEIAFYKNSKLIRKTFQNIQQAF